MTTATLTLTDFLLARIARDEATARERDDEMHYTWDREIDWHTAITETSGYHLLTIPAARVLAECEAKRRIIGNHPHRVDSADVAMGCETCHNGYTDGYCITMRALAAVYADHPDWREEWVA